MIKGKTKEALKDFLLSKEGEEIVGNIILKAMDQALNRKIKIESGKDNPGGPPVIKEEDWNILDFIAKYIPYTEGAIRGCQADIVKVRNQNIDLVEALKRFSKQIELLNDPKLILQSSEAKDEKPLSFIENVED